MTVQKNVKGMNNTNREKDNMERWHGWIRSDGREIIWSLKRVINVKCGWRGHEWWVCF